MSIETLLSRLDKVKVTAPDRWIARCSAHEDRSPSLSIRMKSDGVILLKCLAGCETQSVLDAVGLSFSDLYPERPGHHTRPSKSRIPANDMLVMCDEEVMVAAMAAAEFLDRRSLTEADWQRLAACSERLGRAAAELRR